ncbi:MAG: copper resistance CopC family protein [Kibdelosporangium sp.]
MNLWRTLLVVVVALLATASPASAHVRLLASNPEPGQALDAPPQSVRLTFDDGLKAEPIITVIDPNGSEWPVGRPTMDNKVVTVPVDAQQGPAGNYTVQYRVTGRDDHLIIGEVKFDITAAFGRPGAAQAQAGQAQAGQEPGGQQVDQAAQSSEDGGAPVWIWVAGVLVVAAIVLVEVVRRRRDRPTP